MKSVEVKFHLPLDRVGATRRTIYFDLEEETSLEKFLRLLGKRYPLFRKNFLLDVNTGKTIIPYLLLVINGHAASSEARVKEGDCVEIFPVVGGG